VLDCISLDAWTVDFVPISCIIAGAPSGGYDLPNSGDLPSGLQVNGDMKVNRPSLIQLADISY